MSLVRVVPPRVRARKARKQNQRDQYLRGRFGQTNTRTHGEEILSRSVDGAGIVASPRMSGSRGDRDGPAIFDVRKRPDCRPDSCILLRDSCALIVELVRGHG